MESTTIDGRPETTALDCESAEVLGGKICAAAGLAAQADAQLIELIAEFDAGEAVRWFDGVKSLAHWLSWACSMSAGVAREHVRVARALQRMPVVRAAFAEGRLSYSKVREVTRVVDTVDDARLCELALCATAAQLAKTISGYRSASGQRLKQERERRLTWTERETGNVDIRLRLPKEEAATVIAALNAAKDQFGSPPEPHVGETDATPDYTLADAALDVARTFLDTAPEDRSGEDRSLVVVHVNADQLGSDDIAAEPGGAETDQTETDQTETDQTETGEGVPAGTPTCHVQGVGGIEPETARKLACDNDLLGALVDEHSDVLNLGRTRRLVSRAQRRALMIRDQGRCQFTGCHQSRYLKAHHLIHWFDGGPTDLDNLILLCQFHHTAVHEGRMQIRRVDPEPGSGAARRWEFLMPDGSAHRDWWAAEGLLSSLIQHADHGRAEREQDRRNGVIDDVGSFDHPEARRIQPGWRGERYDRHEAVQALFRMPVRAAARAA